MFWSKKSKVSSSRLPIQPDPNAALVDDIHASYPYGSEAVGMRSFMRMIVFVVLELKKRGAI